MLDPHLGLQPTEFTLAARSMRVSMIVNSLLYPFWGFLVASLDAPGTPPIEDPLLPRLIITALGLLMTTLGCWHAGTLRLLLIVRPLAFLLIGHQLWLLHRNHLVPIYFAILYMMVPLMAMGFVWLGVLRALITLLLGLLMIISLRHEEVPALARLGLWLGTGLMSGLSYVLVLQRHRAVQALRGAQQELLRAHQALATSARAMQDILDNVATGFFLVDRSLAVQAGHSRSCLGLFQAEKLAGQPLPDLLPDLSAEDRTFLQLQLEQAFADQIPAEVSLEQLPTDFSLGGHTLRLQGRAVRDPEGVVQRVLFTATDISDLLASLQRERQHQVLVDLLRRREAFQAFLGETVELLEEARAVLPQGDEATVRRAVHTIKGNAGVFNLEDLMSFLHQIEGREVITQAELVAVQQRLEGFLREHHSVLGMTLAASQHRVYQVDPGQVQELQRLVAPAGAYAQEAVAAWVSRVRSRPARALLEAAVARAERVAERQGKQVQVQIAGGDVPVDPDRLGPVFSVLPHLLINAIDHGIEPPEERGQKPEVAALQVSLRVAGTALQLEVRDDGRGIDGELIGRKAVASGCLSEAALARLTAAERLRLIFLDGLSTAREVTPLSGRGVGMAAVREAVERCGGTLEVESQLGRGTCLRLLLPLPPAPRSSRAPAPGPEAELRP